jgi:predicted HAD superfamily Cof-like phosphohydrolase
MTDEQAMVEAFHRKFEILVQTTPTDVNEETKQLRVRLIQEEFDELKDAMNAGDLAAVAKEMADLLYVTYGTAVSYGIDMEAVFQEVHRSNLSKIGGYKRADGKWVKPPTYSPADIESIVEVQRERRSVERLPLHNAAAGVPRSS